MENNEISTPFFWTDTQQAQERLEGSLVLYGREPVTLRNIREGEEGGSPRVDVTYCATPRTPAVQKRLDSPKFNRFRSLPIIGWVNSPTGQPVFLERRVIRARAHGLNDSNVTVFDLGGKEYLIQPSRDFSFRDIWTTSGFVDSVKGDFPSLEDVLVHIKEKTIIAYSRRYAVLRDTLGIRWLYRNTERIGLFTGNDTLLLLQSTSFYKEEIMEDPLFTLNNIKEF